MGWTDKSCIPVLGFFSLLLQNSSQARRKKGWIKIGEGWMMFFLIVSHHLSFSLEHS